MLLASVYLGIISWLKGEERMARAKLTDTVRVTHVAQEEGGLWIEVLPQVSYDYFVQTQNEYKKYTTFERKDNGNFIKGLIVKFNNGKIWDGILGEWRIDNGEKDNSSNQEP